MKEHAMPLENSSWPSINAFQLACFRAAISQSIALDRRTSIPTNILLGCTALDYGGGGGGGETGPPCSYHLLLRAQPSAGAQEAFRVETVCLEHSHEAKWKPKSAIHRMETWIFKAKAVERRRATKEEEREREKEHESGDSDSKLYQLESEAEGGKVDDVASWESSDIASAAWRYPSAVAVKQDVESLLALGPVPFPTPHSSFTTPTSRELFIVIYAASRQRDFNVHRTSDTANPKRVRLSCAKCHTRYLLKDRCRFSVLLEEVRGRWEVVEWESQHTHPVRGDDGEVIEGQRREGAWDDELAADDADDAESEEADTSDDYDDDNNAAIRTETKQRLGAPRQLLNSPCLPMARLSSTKMAISALAAAGPLSIPSATSDFTLPSAAALREHLSAAAQQRNFSLYVRGNQSAKTFLLKCKLGHSRFGTDLCPYEVRAGCIAGADGPWRVTLLIGKHNHEVRSEADVWKTMGGKGKGKRKEQGHARDSIGAEKRVRSASDDEDVKPSKKKIVPGVLSRRPLPAPLARKLTATCPRASTSASTSPNSFTSGATANHHSAPPKPSRSMLPTPRSSITPADTFVSVCNASAFLPTLTAFLSSLSPTLVPFAPSLHDAGVDSMDSLVGIVYAGDAAVERALLGWESESLQTMPALQRVLFKMGLRRAAEEGRGEG